MGLSAPAVFAPFVRLELLAWDPLYGQRAGAPQPACSCLQRLWTIVLLHNCPELLAWHPLRTAVITTLHFWHCMKVCRCNELTANACLANSCLGVWCMQTVQI